MILGLFVGLAVEAHTATSSTEPNVVGSYQCTVSEKATIGSIHFRGSPSPGATVDKDLPKRFNIKIERDGLQASTFRLSELPYEGADRDRTEFNSGHTVLHSDYLGDGFVFSASKDQAFFRFWHAYSKHADGEYEFYHSGFEYPGGEDTKLSIRWGRCKKL